MSEPIDHTGPVGNDASDAPGYAATMRELEGILDELDRDDVDLDELAGKVRRASSLIESCRARITEVEMEIDQIVAGLDAD